MNQWFRFFLGTPQRFLATLGALTVIYGLIFPQVVGRAVSNLLTELFGAVAPFVQPVLTLMVVLIGVGIMVRKVWHSGGKGGNK